MVVGEMNDSTAVRRFYAYTYRFSDAETVG